MHGNASLESLLLLKRPQGVGRALRLTPEGLHRSELHFREDAMQPQKCRKRFTMGHKLRTTSSRGIGVRTAPQEVLQVPRTPAHATPGVA
eukprot:15390898-Alexandrium_andersonii.AAC.1